jgi:hypothetical protein
MQPSHSHSSRRSFIVQAGKLSKDALVAPPETDSSVEEETSAPSIKVAASLSNSEKDPLEFASSPSAFVDIRNYKPEVDADGTWWVSEIDCEFLATGCSVLACGGGGPGYMCYLAARAAIKAGHRLPVVDVNTLPDDGAVLGSISYGYVTSGLRRSRFTANILLFQCTNRDIGATAQRD